MLALAQDAGGDTVIRTKVNLVLVPVVVRDAKGHTIGHLTRDDFELFDKGKRQTIRSFSEDTHTDGAGSNDSEVVSPAPGRGAPAIPGVLQPDARNGPRGNRVQRHIVYVFDDLNTDFERITVLREAAIRHFAHGLQPADRVAISTFSGRTVLPFTKEQAKLEETVRKLRLERRMAHGEGSPCPDVSYYLADAIINKADPRALEAVWRQTAECAHVKPEMAIMIAQAAARQELLIGAEDTRVAFETLRRAIRLLSFMPGERLIVLASSGFYAPMQDETRNLAALIDLAAKTNVTIGALSARGVDSTGLMDASRRTNMSDVERQYYVLNARVAGEILTDLAEGTGGILYRNNNDLTAGFAHVAAAPEFSYVLGFSPVSLKMNGSFHSLKIRIPNQRGVTVQARHGYYALKTDGPREAAAEALHETVFSRDERSDIPVDVAMQVSSSGKGDSTLMVLTKVRAARLHFQKSEDRNHDSLTVVSAVFDQEGGYVAGIQKTVNLALRDASLNQDPGINVQSDFVLQPGSYVVRVVVREAEGKTMTAYNRNVTIREATSAP